MNTYEIVTEALLMELRKGVVPWRRPWTADPAATVNYVSRHPYSFLNRILLPKSGEYLTENQIRELGGRMAPSGKTELQLDVWAANRYTPRQMTSWWNTLTFEQKDEKYMLLTRGHIVTFFKMVPDKDEQGEELENSSHPILRFYRVYHLDDTEGIPSKNSSTSVAFSTEFRDAGAVVDDYSSRTGVNVGEETPGCPRYTVDDDTVHVPVPERFSSEEERLSTLFHFLVRSSLREGRAGEIRGENALTRGDLAAEMGSAMICTDLQLDTQEVWENQAAYIARWISDLERDPSLVVRAASAAEKAATFILQSNRQPS